MEWKVPGKPRISLARDTAVTAGISGGVGRLVAPEADRPGRSMREEGLWGECRVEKVCTERRREEGLGVRNTRQMSPRRGIIKIGEVVKPLRVDKLRKS